jgi:hypothetical protein
MKSVQSIKQDFKKILQNFASSIGGFVSAQDNQWTVKGFIDVFQKRTLQKSSIKSNNFVKQRNILIGNLLAVILRRLSNRQRKTI